MGIYYLYTRYIDLVKNAIGHLKANGNPTRSSSNYFIVSRRYAYDNDNNYYWMTHYVDANDNIQNISLYYYSNGFSGESICFRIVLKFLYCHLLSF